MNSPVSRSAGAARTSEPISNRLREVVVLYVDDCCRRRTPPRAKELAGIVGISPQHLSFEFRRLGGNLGRMLKIEHAARAALALRATTAKNADVAEVIGFGGLPAFYRVFRSVFGMTPNRYRVLAMKQAEQATGVVSGPLRNDSRLATLPSLPLISVQDGE